MRTVLKFLGLVATAMVAVSVVPVTTAESGIESDTVVVADEYPDIRAKFDVSDMSQYSDEDLSVPVKLTKFYVQETHKDRIGSYHYLLTPSHDSDQYFLLVSNDRIKKLKTGKKVSLNVTLNGSGVVNMGYKSSPYQHEPAALVMN